jgi:thioredoxin 2
MNAATASDALQLCPGCGAKNRLQTRRDEPARCGRCHAPLPPPAKTARPVTVTDQTFRAEVEQSAGSVLVDFWAPWCGPCRAVAPMLEQLARQRSGRLKIAKVNVDENPGLSARFGIRSIPTLALFRGGAFVAELRGAVPKESLESWLAQHDVP